MNHVTSSFMTVKNDGNSEWCVVQNSFPKISGSTVTTSIDSKVCECFKDEKEAIIEAKKTAEINQFQFVPNNTNAITVSPFADCWLVVELTPNGGVSGKKQLYQISTQPF